MAERLVLSGPGGRSLDVELAGPPDGLPLVLHTGTPGGGSLFASHVALAQARGVRSVSYARPGYAGSDRAPNRRVADCAIDVAAIADALGFERFYTVGTSGGGPHALACAALLGDRVIAASTIAGVAPYDATGLDWLDGMGAENVEEFGAAAAGEDELAEYLDPFVATLREASGADLAAGLGDLVSEVDRAALAGDFADYLARDIATGLAAGSWGWFDDDVAFLADWGVDLAAVRCPVTIWQGGEDRFVPRAHGVWLAQHVNGATAELREGHGHLSLQSAGFADVLDGLIASGALAG
jgi:pimeloyl-ACP methyl ester carboxylesterase